MELGTCKRLDWLFKDLSVGKGQVTLPHCLSISYQCGKSSMVCVDVEWGPVGERAVKTSIHVHMHAYSICRILSESYTV